MLDMQGYTPVRILVAIPTNAGDEDWALLPCEPFSISDYTFSCPQIAPSLASGLASGLFSGMDASLATATVDDAPTAFRRALGCRCRPSHPLHDCHNGVGDLERVHFVPSGFNRAGSIRGAVTTTPPIRGAVVTTQPIQRELLPPFKMSGFNAGENSLLAFMVPMVLPVDSVRSG